MIRGCANCVIVLLAAVAALVGATDRGYCEAPHPVAVPPDPITSQLLQVVVLSRHGDRSPLRPIPNEYLDKRVVWNCSFRAPLRAFTADARLQSTTFVFFLFSLSLYFTTHFTHVSLKKTTKTTFFTITITTTTNRGLYYLYDEHGTGVFGDNSSWNGNCEAGQLTARGGEMCAQMGAGLREIYVDKFGLLPAALGAGDADLLYLRTTDFVRTRESLASLMEGLYPADRRAGVYLPVHVVATDADYMHPNVVACPRLAQLVEKNTVANPEWMAHFARVRPVLARVNALAGTANMSGFDSAYTVDAWADILHARECHDLPYPCARDGRACVTQDMVDALADAAAWEAAHLYAGDEAQRLAAGPFFMDLARIFAARVSHGTHSTQGARMPHASTRASTARYHHYSAHDSTIDTVVSALKVDGGFPPYASTVRFELWQTAPAPAPAYAVQIVYNNRVLQPPECSAPMCPLSDFLAMVNTRLTIRNKDLECARR